LIDDIDRALASWVSTIVGAADVVLGRPSDDAGVRPTVGLYLLELDHTLPTHRSERRPLEIALRYLVTTSAPDVEQAHRLLGSLVFAALERTDLQVDLRPLAPEIWAAFGVTPRPAFTLRHPLVVERPSRVGRVRTPAEITLGSATGLNGVVLTKADVPVPYARVELPGLDASTYTDVDGRFDLGAVPSDARTKPFRVVAKGADELAPAETGADGRLVIRFDPKET
jgi:hypothetical protein